MQGPVKSPQDTTTTVHKQLHSPSTLMSTLSVSSWALFRAGDVNLPLQMYIPA